MGIFRETNNITWPVKVLIPVGGSKRTSPEEFLITVKIIPMDERETLSQSIGKDSTKDEIQDFTRKSLEMVINNIDGWNIENLEFNPSNLERVMNNPYYRKGISEAFWAAQNGGDLKN